MTNCSFPLLMDPTRVATTPAAVPGAPCAVAGAGVATAYVFFEPLPLQPILGVVATVARRCARTCAEAALGAKSGQEAKLLIRPTTHR